MIRAVCINVFAGTALALATSQVPAQAAASTSTQPVATAAEADLRRITQELLDAVAPGRVDVWQRYLDERLIHVDETGVVRSKAELLSELRPLPAGLVGRLEIDSFKAEIHGNVAVVAHEDQEHLDYFGQTLRSRFRSTDTWLKTPQGWRLIAEQTAAVLKDPPKISLTKQQLCGYNGSYSLTPTIATTVQCAGDGLKVERAGRPAVTYVAEVADVFFVPGQPRTRRIFMRDPQGKVTGFVDRREGEDIHWTKQS